MQRRNHLYFATSTSFACRYCESVSGTYASSKIQYFEKIIQIIVCVGGGVYWLDTMSFWINGVGRIRLMVATSDMPFVQAEKSGL